MKSFVVTLIFLVITVFMSFSVYAEVALHATVDSNKPRTEGLFKYPLAIIFESELYWYDQVELRCKNYPNHGCNFCENYAKSVCIQKFGKICYKQKFYNEMKAEYAKACKTVCEIHCGKNVDKDRVLVVGYGEFESYKQFLSTKIQFLSTKIAYLRDRIYTKNRDLIERLTRLKKELSIYIHNREHDLATFLIEEIIPRRLQEQETKTTKRITDLSSTVKTEIISNVKQILLAIQKQNDKKWAAKIANLQETVSKLQQDSDRKNAEIAELRQMIINLSNQLNPEEK